MKTEWLGKRRGSRREFEIFEKPQRAQLTFPSGSVVKKKKLPANAGDVGSLGWEDPLEKEMTTHSSTLAWEIPRTEEPGRLQSMGSQRVRHD